MAQLVRDPSLGTRMGLAGRARVRRHFSRDEFAHQLESTCCDLVKDAAVPSRKPFLMLFIYVLLFVVLPSAACVCLWYKLRA